MPIKRGSDGRPIAVPTQPPNPSEGRRTTPSDSVKRRGLEFWPGDDEPTVPGGQRRTSPIPGEKAGPKERPQDDRPTEPSSDRMKPADQSGQSRQRGEEPTVVDPRHRIVEQSDQPDTPGSPPAALPTGWLVVIDGPGKGSVLPLGFGHNKIGRGADMRVRLDFGDGAISREHTAIRYSDRNNTFHIFPGNNNVYLAENEEVLAPTPLSPGCVIGLGETTLRFVPFCDESFRWE